MTNKNLDANTGLNMLAGGTLVPQINSEIRPLAEVERAYIETVISLCDGNIPKAAGFLEVSPSTLYRKRSRWA